jgi:hypothetical protein
LARTISNGFSLLALSLLALGAPALAGETLVARSYDVSALVRSSESSHSPSLGLIQSHTSGILSFEEEDAGGELILAGEALVRFLRQDLVRAKASKFTHFKLKAGTLEVLAPAQTHAALQASLARVRAQVARRITLEVHVLALEPARARGLGSAGAIMEAQHHALLSGGAAIGGVRITARDRQPASGSLLQRSTFLGDFEVNQTGTIPVLNSVVERLLEGLVADVTCRLPLGDGPALLECRVEHARQPGPARTQPFAPGGVLDLPSLDHMALSGSLRLRVGETGLLGTAPLPKLEGKARSAVVLVTLRSVQARPAIGPKSIGLRAYDLTRLGKRLDDYFTRPDWSSDSGGGGGGAGAMFSEEDEEGPQGSFLNVNAIRELALSKVDPGTWASDNGSKENWILPAAGAISVAQSAAGHQRLEAFLSTLQPTPPLLRYELTQLEVSGALSAAPTLSPEAAEALAKSGTVSSRLSLSAFPAQGAEALSRRESRFVSDIERASGCGANDKSVQVDDPVVETLAAGVSLRVKGNISGEEISLETDLDLRGRPTLRPSKTRWGVIELYSASHRNLRRKATLTSGGGILLTTQVEGKARVYLLRVWADR